MKAWLFVAFAAPLLVAAPFTIPILAQDKAAAAAAAAKAPDPESKEEKALQAASAKEEAELAAERRKRTIINDVTRCPKRPTENQFRTYNLLNDQMLKLKEGEFINIFN